MEGRSLSVHVALFGVRLSAGRILGKIVKKKDCADDWGWLFILIVTVSSLLYCAVGFVRFYR